LEIGVSLQNKRSPIFHELLLTLLSAMDIGRTSMKLKVGVLIRWKLVILGSFKGHLGEGGE